MPLPYFSDSTKQSLIIKRLRSGRNSSIVLGTSWVEEQTIQVNFWWLSLPVLLYAAITFFFFYTVWKSSRTNTPLWKSSILIPLQVMNADNGLGTKRQVERQSRTNNIQLIGDGSNWRLVDTTPAQDANERYHD